MVILDLKYVVINLSTFQLKTELLARLWFDKMVQNERNKTEIVFSFGFWDGMCFLRDLKRVERKEFLHCNYVQRSVENSAYYIQYVVFSKINRIKPDSNWENKDWNCLLFLNFKGKN